jgi:hypothetical protein
MYVAMGAAEYKGDSGAEFSRILVSGHTSVCAACAIDQLDPCPGTHVPACAVPACVLIAVCETPVQCVMDWIL